MKAHESAGELNRAVRAHVHKVGSRATGKLLRESARAIEPVIVCVETYALELPLKLKEVIGYSIEGFILKLYVFRLPGCTHDVVNGLGVQQQTSFLTVTRQSRHVFQIVKVNGSVYLYGVVFEFAQYVIERRQ